jgi:DNA-binding NtrC family response regulator
MRIFFEAEGCYLLALETAEEGLVELENDTYDIIIVDYKLPRMDGIEFFKHIRNVHSNALKILITAYKSTPVVSDARNLDIHGLIEKPLTSDTIMESISYLLKKREKREEVHAR